MIYLLTATLIGAILSWVLTLYYQARLLQLRLEVKEYQFKKEEEIILLKRRLGEY